MSCKKWFLLLVFLLSVIPEARGMDRRYALVVVNQQGWKQDPLLKYAIKGDALPLAKVLKKLGFQVKTLVNASPQTLRTMLKQLEKRFQRRPKISTFLFYYSGHADQHRLHMGPDVKNALTYKEFISTFRLLQTKRKFAIFDACFSGELIRMFGSLKQYQQLLKKGQVKGVSRRTSINISKLSLPNQGQEEGLRIIASSLLMSWELHQYKASVFTHHMLKGLKGSADLDKDGKISVDELFDYTSREVKKVTGQKPQQLVMTRRTIPYALAPAYRSRLRLGSDLVGKLEVSASNFLWTYHKRQRGPLTIDMVDGKGLITLSKGKKCWKQHILLPKGGEAQLGKNWQKWPCKKLSSLRKKGIMSLPARLTSLETRQEEQTRSLALTTGITQQGLLSLQSLQPTVGLDFREQWWQIGLGFSHGFSLGRSFSLSRFFLQGALTWPFHFTGPSFRGELKAGLFGQLGLVFLHQDKGGGAIQRMAAAGGLLDFTWWFRPSWGLRCHIAVGFDHTPTAQTNGFSLFWRSSLGLAWTL